MITIETPATSRRLTSREAIVAATGWLPDTYDEIIRASAMVEQHIGRALALEEVTETFLLPRSSWAIQLSRWPVRQVVSIIEDGRPVDPAGFEVDRESGLIRRLWNDRPATWMPVRISARYWSGYILPTGPGLPADRDLPAAIEDAVIQLAFALRPGNILAGGGVKRVGIEGNGGLSVEFNAVPQNVASSLGGMSPAILELLRPFRQVAIGAA